MKTVLLILTTSLVFAASAALAQEDGCSKQYGACMDHCSQRPQTVQSTCSETCEANTNQCYVTMYGHPPAEGQVTVTVPSPAARDAQGSATAPAEGKDK